MSKKIIDKALYTTVQPHYIANAKFEGLDEPLPQRSGFLEGESDVVITPEIPPPPKKENNSDIDNMGEIGELSYEQFEQVSEWVADHDPGKGERNRYYGAMSGALHRWGINAEDVSEIIYEAACAANDEEANSRQTCAINACDAIDRGMPMTGLNVLINEFDIEGHDEIIALLGAKKIDPQ